MTNPIELSCSPAEVTDRFATGVEVPPELLAEIASFCALDDGPEARLDYSRDWWPLALWWATRGQVPARPAGVARPGDAETVADVLRLCSAAGVPVTPAGGRSGVCGGSVPVFGGIVLDTCALSGASKVDADSLLVDVGAGTLGSVLESELAASHALSVGHRPQSIDLATVGGWLACRGAGQYSTRYGKIEDIVAGLEVVLADGRVVRTGAMAGAGPRSAMGPDLTQIFVGSEGALGVITAARLRAHPLPAVSEKRAFGFAEFSHGLEALRLTLRRGARPAVLRLYDADESSRSFGLAGTNVLVALDEGDEHVVGGAMAVLAAECAAASAEVLSEDLVDMWLRTRNDVSALASLTRAGIVVDTIEVAAPWSALEDLYGEALAELRALDGCLAASAHESHAYPDGACLYITFAGRRPEAGGDGFEEDFYRHAWNAVMGVTSRRGGSISHHHGIGLVRGDYLPGALGKGFAVLEALKAALDPRGILNPGKLGLRSRFGPAPFVMSGPTPPGGTPPR